MRRDKVIRVSVLLALLAFGVTAAFLVGKAPAALPVLRSELGLTLVEAGLLAKAGLNAHGIGVVTYGLTCTDDKGGPGLPCHVLLRALLDAPDPAACLGVLKRGDRASSANYLFA